MSRAAGSIDGVPPWWRDREGVLMVECPQCGGSAEVTRNPDRLTLPKNHGKCSACGHEWNFNSVTPRDSRLGM
jgi:uncharacterized Zn finger protein